MNFHRDKTIRLDYNPVLDAEIQYNNAIGATDSLTLRTLDITPSDTNTVYVKKTGSDSTGTGTAADPVLTIEYADSLLTASKNYIVIMDSAEYTENSHAFSENCKGIFAAIGQKPVLKSLLITNSTNYLISTLKNKTAIATSGGIYGYTPKIAALSNGDFVVVYTKHPASGQPYYLCYMIINSNGEIIIAEQILQTSNESTALNNPDVCSLSDNFVIAVHNFLTDLVYYWVFNNSGNAIYSSSYVSATASYTDLPLVITPVGGYSDRFAIVAHKEEPLNTLKLYCSIYSTSGVAFLQSQLLSSYIFELGGTGFKAIKIPNGGFIVFYRTFSTKICRWIVLDKYGAELHNDSFSSDITWISGVVNDDSNSVIFACNSSNNIKFIEYNLSDYTVKINFTTIYTSADGSMITLLKLSNNNYAVASGGGSGSLYFIDSKWEVLASESITATIRGFHAAFNKESNSVFVAYPDAVSPYQIFQYIKGGFLTDWWKFSSDIIINGLTFNNEEKYVYKYLSSSAGNIKFKWSTFENIARSSYKDSDKYPLYVCEAAVTSAEILNCQVFNNNAGFKIASNSVLVQHSQFFKQLLNSALKITGAGSGIIVNHCDFLYNYICIELIGNNGSEVLKNNIFYTSLLFCIKAATAVGYSHTIENSESFNATPGSQVIRSHPHYINDGYVSLDVMDLVLKCRELGYKFDSPALRIGDDTKNAGSVDFEIVGATQTWDSITVAKPEIKKGYNPVGAIETSYSDGSVETFRNSYTEVLNLGWDNVVESDFLKLIEMYFSAMNVVKIFLDPVSEPTTYGMYKLVYDKVNASPEFWQFDDLGKNGFTLTFKRAYNEGL